MDVGMFWLEVWLISLYLTIGLTVILVYYTVMETELDNEFTIILFWPVVIIIALIKFIIYILGGKTK